MRKCKIHVLYPFVDGPWGGGNQFLKALKREFSSMGIWTDNPSSADVILFNSHSFLDLKTLVRLLYALLSSGPKTIIHRIDGPIFSVRGKDLSVDKLIFAFNGCMASGTVFQSEWSKQECVSMGLLCNKHETVIANSPDQTIFYPLLGYKGPGLGRVRLIATSWSGNPRKGFDIYKYLDEHLDFTRYEMTFVGNSPITFKNIQMVPPQNSMCLADLLRAHDIYISASKNDPCSNSLLEAVSCGLPAVALKSGGHPELIGAGGELFNGEEDVLSVIESVRKNLNLYRTKISSSTIAAVAEKYVLFFKEVNGDSAARTCARDLLGMIPGLIRYKVVGSLG